MGTNSRLPESRGLGEETAARFPIAFFGHDSTESTIVKRVTAFEANGARVAGFMFRRRRGGERRPTWENIDLGMTAERNYATRVPKLIAAVFIVLRYRALLRQCRVFYARNIDMLFLAAVARTLSRANAKLVYEVLDVQRVFLGPRFINRVFRWMERVLLTRCDLLIVSSPDFISHYFVPWQRYEGPWRLLENKVAASQLPADVRKPEHELPSSPPWVIGWFGILRCARSLDILCRIADALGDRVSIRIRGIVSADDLSEETIVAAQNGRRSLVFGGAYVSPQDLPELYGKVHFAWCADYLDAGTNSDWLLPNRLYEGGLMGSVALARKGTATGRYVEREGLGWAFAEPLEQAIIDHLGTLTSEDYEAARARVEKTDRSLFIDEGDTRDLLQYLNDCSTRRM